MALSEETLVIVGAVESNVQLVLLSELVILKPDVAMAVALTLLESFTSKYSIVLVPWGSMLHWVPVIDERKDSRAPDAPCAVHVPAMVWVTEAGKVRVRAVATVLVRLLKVEVPDIVWSLPSKVKVPELWVKVPPEWSKLAETWKVAPEEGAVKVPDDMMSVPLMSTVPELEVNVPPDTVSPPSKVWVAVLAV